MPDKYAVREQVLEQARACVCGQRVQDYGEPEDNFTAIANYWSVYKGIEFTRQDVSNMMILLKLSRVMSGHATVDSYVDIAGYAACAGEIASELLV